MTGVISALPVNHRVGLSLENLILKIRSRVNDRHSLWGKLLSSMIRLRLNITIDFLKSMRMKEILIIFHNVYLQYHKIFMPNALQFARSK